MKLIDLMEVGTLYNEDIRFIWNEFVLDKRLDREVLIDCIINELCQCEPLTNTVLSFKAMTNTFFKKWEHEITKLTDTLFFEYTPIWNKDGTIKEWHKSERDRRENENQGQKTDENTTDTGTDNITHQNNHEVSAYNADGYQPHSMDNGADNETRELRGTRNVNVDTDRKLNETDNFREGTERIEQGNIGVTSTQSLIQEERELMEFNIYSWIVEKYGNECFLKIW